MRKERGFTLIELLVVIAILAVLFGVTALALTNVGSNAAEEVKAAELTVVQAAVDVCDAISSCDIQAATNEAVGPATGAPNGVGNYLRRTSEYNYTWGSDGVVTQN